MYSSAKDDAPIRVISTMKFNISNEENENIFTPIIYCLSILSQLSVLWNTPEANRFKHKKQLHGIRCGSPNEISRNIYIESHPELMEIGKAKHKDGHDITCAEVVIQRH